MKKLITDYVFNASNKTITFSQDISLEQILLITNVTQNVIIYNFASSGGTLIGRTLTVAFNTTSMQNSDDLQIFVDVPDVDFASLNALLQDGLIEIVRQLQAIRNDGGMADATGRVRVALESSPATVPISITDNQDIRNITGNLTSIGGYTMSQAAMNWNNLAAKELRHRITIT